MATDGKAIFISYSHKDRKSFEEFNTMLAPALRRGLLNPWHDQKLAPGALWKDEIENALEGAKVAVLLVSKNFLASPFIADNELAPLLSAAGRRGLVIFWIYLSACMYEESEVASYQAAHDIARPLDRLSKPERQGVLSEVCAKLLKIVDANRAEPVGSKVENRAAPAKHRSASHFQCCVLLLEALRQGWLAAAGMGPTTALHRQAVQAKRWLDEGTRLLPESRGFYALDLAKALDRASQQTIPRLLAWPPNYGTFESNYDRHSDAHKEQREVQHQADLLSEEIDRYIKDDPGLAAFRQSDQIWAVLGFRDEQDFKEYLYPSVHRLVQNPDPMQRDLLERLVAASQFTIRELHGEGYRKDIVMDSLNALLAEKWAQWEWEKRGADWADYAGPRDAEDQKIIMTGVGVRLMKQLLTDGSAGSAGSKSADYWYPRRS